MAGTVERGSEAVAGDLLFILAHWNSDSTTSPVLDDGMAPGGSSCNWLCYPVRSATDRHPQEEPLTAAGHEFRPPLRIYSIHFIYPYQ